MSMNPDDKAVPLTQDAGNIAIVQGHDGPHLVQGNVFGALQTRKRHRCCGCCCDTRRAVIAVNVVGLCLTFLGIMMPFLFYTPVEKAVMVLGMICQVAGIYGAFKFNKIGVAIGAIWYALEAIRRMSYFDYSGYHMLSQYFPYPVPKFLDFVGLSIVYVFFSYPHVVLLLEMDHGIMTPDWKF
jgi:hypothetical protein